MDSFIEREGKDKEILQYIKGVSGEQVGVSLLLV